MGNTVAVSVPTRPITAEEYARMVEVGILRRDERVELLNGRIVEMPPIGPPHGYIVDALTASLFLALGTNAVVRTQGSVKIASHSWPQPDIAVLRGPRMRYAESDAAAADVLLIVEVADTSLAYDRGEKAIAYARAGICEYWLIDVKRGTIQVFGDPSNGRYRTERIVRRGEILAPRAFADSFLRTEDFLLNGDSAESSLL